ncbi:hypothetical protein [Phytomonospora endophytica]|uniref:hypothetical protein n=1 Tax=Phytomonospora endophytica TaxID=714109 RepID=UPI001609FAA2|nr:hypothetical protein [Phytomonospora endophytica]GIG64261.1 hypothetical protein Pen01_05560 [Phytomonospora endophytica]
MDGYPDVGKVRAWLKLATSSVDDAELGVILAAEIASQGRACRVPADGPDADQYAALLRRCARAVAARGVPLGVMGGADEYGPVRLPAIDSELERLEGPTRKVVMG